MLHIHGKDVKMAFLSPMFTSSSCATCLHAFFTQILILRFSLLSHILFYPSLPHLDESFSQITAGFRSGFLPGKSSFESRQKRLLTPQ